MRTHDYEKAGLWVSLGAALIVAPVAVGVSIMTSSQAVLLDGLFNAVYAIAAVFTIYVAGLLRKSPTARFPFGYSAFVPLTNVIKSLLLTGVSIFALLSAIISFFTGGNEVPLGSAALYSIYSMVVASLAAFMIWRFSGKTDSELLKADLMTWLINAGISACLVISFGAALALQSAGQHRIALYVDSALVTLLVIFSIGVPYSMGKGALSELLAKAPAADERLPVIAKVRSAIDAACHFPSNILALKTGMDWTIVATVSVPAAVPFTVDDADRVRCIANEQILREMKAGISILFTRDEATTHS